MSLYEVGLGYTENPGYFDLLLGIYKNVKWYYRFDSWKNYSVPNDFYADVVENFDFPAQDAYPIIYIAIFFTLIRYLFEFSIGKVCILFLCFYVLIQKVFKR